MTHTEFTTAIEQLGLSRAAFCRLIGIAPNSGTAYAAGRKPVPRVVELAIQAITLRGTATPSARRQSGA